MDILNWLYLRKEQLIRKTANNPETDLVAVGADVSFAKRDDQYKTYAMPIKDLVNSADAANTGYYTLDFNDTFVVDVTTPKGVIEITMVSPSSAPAANFATSVPLVINNPDMDFSDADKIYMQVTPYYNPEFNDAFIPYLLSTGFVPSVGANFEVFNASSVQIGGLASYGAAGTAILAEANKFYTVGAVGGSGIGVAFAVVRDALGAISSVNTITTETAGTNYQAGDVLTIPGTWVGGATPADDITINVGSVTNENVFGGKFYVYYELYNF